MVPLVLNYLTVITTKDLECDASDPSIAGMSLGVKIKPTKIHIGIIKRPATSSNRLDLFKRTGKWTTTAMRILSTKVSVMLATPIASRLKEGKSPSNNPNRQNRPKY